MELDATELSVINVDQFYGIELDEFAARIAETALWMMDHIMNNRLSLEFGRSYVRIPLRRSPHILNEDALETDWSALLPPTECAYVFGNPPFGGAKYQSTKQRKQVRRIASLGRSGGTLDYVSAWFILAGRYSVAGNCHIAFVATNSITQGEQVAQLWPLLFEQCSLEIAFAHRTFAWGSDARGKAHVHVVIVGLTPSRAAPKERRLFSYEDLTGEPHESTHSVITPYLFDGSRLADPHLVVRETSTRLNGMPVLRSGSQPIDDGNYSFTAEERLEFLEAEPGAQAFMRPYIGSKEHINGIERWILALQNASPSDLQRMPKVRDRMRAVREFRRRSSRKGTLAIADYPAKFNVEVIPPDSFLVVPKVSSERRAYIPIAWVDPPTIPSDLVFVLTGATKPVFGLLTSTMHMSWLRHIGGRLKSDFRYSIGLVYNTFPLPPPSKEAIGHLKNPAEAVLEARAAHPGLPLATLYDPDLMPANLRRAHQTLDRAVDRLYRKAPFTSDRERAEHLFGLYEAMTTPLVGHSAAVKKGRRRGSRKSR